MEESQINLLVIREGSQLKKELNNSKGFQEKPKKQTSWTEEIEEKHWERMEEEWKARKDEKNSSN